MLSLSACNGIFGDIYDTPTPEQDSEYGFVAVDEQKGTGRIYINATDYSQWHYIDLHRKQVITARPAAKLLPNGTSPYTVTTPRPGAVPWRRRPRRTFPCFRERPPCPRKPLCRTNGPRTKSR